MNMLTKTGKGRPNLSLPPKAYIIAFIVNMTR
jgi:hypothetical protein